MHSRPLLLLWLLLCACSQDAAEAAATPSDASDAVAIEEGPLFLVRTELPQRRPIERVLETIADVVSLDEVDVFPEQTGPIVAIIAEEGQRVAAGELLCNIRDTERQLSLQEAQVRLDEARQEASRAERDHQRNQNLATQATQGGTSLLSERELETSAQTLVAALTARKAAQVAVDRAAFELEQCSVLSPIAGVVTLREVSLGDTASPSKRAYRIVDDIHPRVVFYRPQREMSSLQVGQTLVGTSEALSFSVSGVLERIAPVVDQESGTLKVTAILQTKESEPIPIGLLLHLRIVLERHDHALLIPKRAILHESGQSFFYVAREGKAVRIPLIPGFEDSDFMEVLRNEADLPTLTTEDAVIVVGGERLDDGSRVDVVE